MRAQIARRRLVPLLVFALVASTCAEIVFQARPASAAVGDITAFAGSAGTGTATNVAMAVQGVAVSGTFVYIADDTNMVIRKFDTAAGTISVPVSYSAAGAFAGDGAAATAARLNAPQG